MSHPTSFFILENEELGQFWIGQMKMKLGIYGQSLLPSITRNQLVDKLVTKYEEYSYPCLEVERVKKDGTYLFYGLEQWLTKLDCEIKRNPRKLRDVNEILTAGWIEGDPTINSTVHVLHINNTKEVVQKVYRKLLKEWEAKGLECLNKLRYKTDKEKYEDKKKDPEFMYKRARKEVLRQMEKTKKIPKDATIEKYDIRDEEIKECMGPTGIIYKITSPSGKVYVGQTVRPFEERIYKHKHKSSQCTVISKAIQKYGDEMNYELIEENVPQEQLDEREIYWIKELNSLAPSGYNLTTGGQFTKGYSQELKDKMRDGMIKSIIERNGYLGYIHPYRDLLYPVVHINGKIAYLSKGAFRTEEECIEVLKEYTKDPENFVKVDGTIQRSTGSVGKHCNKWSVRYKNLHLGSYDTEEEAHKALKKYLEDPDNFVKPEKKVGCVYKKHHKWGVKYKHKYLGSYATQEEAEEVRKTLQSSRYSSSSDIC